MNEKCSKSNYLMHKLIAISFFILTSNTQAALNDLGNGLIKDTTTNLIWLKDANLFKTLCDAYNPIATEFIPVDSADSFSICNNNGEMTWYDAEKWISRLNSYNYLGYSDWRLPNTSPLDGVEFNYTWKSDGSSDTGYNISAIGTVYAGSTANEMAFMYYYNLGNEGWEHIDGSSNHGDEEFCSEVPPYCLQITTSFQNLQSSIYWTGITYEGTTFIDSTSEHAWTFNTEDGYPGHNAKDGGESGWGFRYVWPVRSDLPETNPISQQIPSLLLLLN